MTYTMTTPLQQAAAALMDAMDQTDFTCRIGEQLDALEKALEAEQAHAVEPAAWGMMKNGLMLDIICPDEHESFEGDYTIPLYTHPSPPATGERAELIDMCATAEANAFTEENRNFYKSMKDMLEADAQEIEGWKADQKENLCNQVELQGRINDLKAQQLAVTAWKAEQIDYFEIRVTSPEGESWRFRSADRNDIFNNFIWRWAQSMMTAQGAKP